jgi:hypothetical protein
MVFDFKSWLSDWEVEYREHGKNWQPGWVQINCPFCADAGFHGGCNLSGGYYHCWRCGGHSNNELIQEIERIGYFEAKNTLRVYRSHLPGIFERKKASAKICQFPPGTISPIASLPGHLQYLEKRGFRAEDLRWWNLWGTGPLGPYRFRVLIPIILDRVMVSYQGRDITNRQELRYKACKIENEVIHHKHILYGFDYVQEDRVIIVEGVTDVWRFGPGTVCTFGTEYSVQQVKFLYARGIKQAVIVFDPGAERQAGKLEADLNALGIDANCCFLPEGIDPAEMSQEQADTFLEQAKNKFF